MSNIFTLSKIEDIYTHQKINLDDLFEKKKQHDLDEVRLFNVERTESQMNYGLNMQIPVNTAGLQAYYQFNGSPDDETANSNDLTLQNSPVYSTDVPYASPTTRALGAAAMPCPPAWTPSALLPSRPWAPTCGGAPTPTPQPSWMQQMSRA